MKQMTSTVSARVARLPALFQHDGWRWLAPVAVAAAVMSGGEIGMVVRDTLAEAYLQVSVFVAATLIVFYAVEQWLGVDLNARLARARAGQVPIATALGMLPGCGGAIVVVTQFVNGRISFGSLVAVLIATMGDAAFLLIASAPQTAVMVLGISGACAILFGWAVDAWHGRDFMRHAIASGAACDRDATNRRVRVPALFEYGWLGLWVVGVPFALGIAFQADPNEWFGALAAYKPVTWIGFAGAMLAMVMWAARYGEADSAPAPVESAGYGSPLSNPAHRASVSASLPAARGLVGWARRARTDTNFVTVWVIAAFLLFELGIVLTGAEPKAWLAVAGPLVPLVGVLVGFIPGCGPQILLTTLYLNGAVPVSALLANAISNDGDALFPAIALAPRAAVLATLYSAIPALAVGYTAFGLGY